MRFKVEGVPAPQGSKSRGRGGHLYEANKRLKPWRDKMIAAARLAHPGPAIDAPVEVIATFYVPRPQRPKFLVPATPSDLDKYARALGDALTQAGAIKDDARIVHWDCWKAYHSEGWTGVEVEVRVVA